MNPDILANVVRIYKLPTY